MRPATRVALALVVALVLPAVALTATHRRADSVCQSDPPGARLTAYDERTLDLRRNGWQCRLTGVGDVTVDVPLGWWPDTAAMR